MNPFYPEVARRAEHRCEYCHAPEDHFNFEFEVEHIIPQASGGLDAGDNLALACRACNAFKSVRDSGIDPVTGETAQLFHPRRGVWTDHFQVEAVDIENERTDQTIQTWKIVGKTPIGRATVVVLNLNSKRQLLARSQWKEHFP